MVKKVNKKMMQQSNNDVKMFMESKEQNAKSLIDLNKIHNITWLLMISQ